MNIRARAKNGLDRIEGSVDMGRRPTELAINLAYSATCALLGHRFVAEYGDGDELACDICAMPKGTSRFNLSGL